MSFDKWRKVRLETVCKKITDGSHWSPKNAIKGYPMASVKNLTYYDINIEECRRITKEDYEKLIKNDCKPLNNDVLVAKDGSYLKNIIVISEERDIVVLSSIAILRPDLDKINPYYLKYYLLNPESKNRIKQGYISGSALPRIILKDFKKYEINLTSLEEQEKIASILSCLDDKIELNNQINKNLEQIAQAIFKRWFVDFEFPNENGKPYKSSGGEMIDSELGPIPKEWVVIPFKEIIKISSGKRPKVRKKEKDKKFNIPLIGASSIMGYISEVLYIKPILIIGRVGTHGVVQRIKEKSWPSDNTLVIQSEHYEYTYQILKNIDYQSLNRGSTQPLITQTDIKKYKIIFPKNNLLRDFEKRIGCLFQLINKNKEENKVLSGIRDKLLPKLMSGEIRVPINNKEGDE